MKKILVTGGELENKGAQSMVFITVDELHKRFPNHEIVVISPFDINRSDEEKSNYKFTIDVMHSLVPMLKKISLKHKLYYMLKRYDKQAYKESLDFYSKVDMLVDISGYGLGSDWNDYEVENYLLRILLGKTFNFKVYLMPQSFGPFNYDGKKKKIKRQIKKCLAYPERICAREEHGYNILKKEFALNNVIKTNDIVLCNKKIDYSNIFVSCPKLNIPKISYGSVAIIPNSQNVKFGNKQEIFLMYKSIIEFLLSCEKNVYILRHSKIDLDLCRELSSFYANNSQVILLEDDFSSLEFNGFVSNFDFVIASRFHAVVHSYKNGVPSVTLGWAIKYQELHAIFNQDKFVFDVKNNMDKDAILNAVKYMVENSNIESEKISNKLETLQKENVFDIISLE